MLTNQPNFLDLKKYEIGTLIGKGQYGLVYQIKHKVTNDYYAAKISKFIVDEDTENQEEVKYLFREINIFSILDHPSILKFIGYSPINFEGDPTPTIVTEFAVNNSLLNIIKNEISGLSPPNWNFTKKLIVIYGVASGMSYLHKHNVIHRDLKPDNILMDEDLYPKIADFGMSKLSDILLVSMNFQSQNGFKGTPMFIAPEVFQSDNNTKEGDVYSFAMLVYILLTGEIPFKGMHFLTLIQKVVKGFRPEITCDVPDVYRELIENCWDQDPKKRPTFDQITNEIRTNDNFIIDIVDKDEFDCYVEKVDKYQTSFNTSKRLLHFNEFINGMSKKRKYIFENIIDSDSDSDSEQDLGVIEIQLENKKETNESNDKFQNNIRKPIQGSNEKSIDFPKLNNDFFVNFPKPNNEPNVNIPKPNNEFFINIPKPKNESFVIPKPIQGFNEKSVDFPKQKNEPNVDIPKPINESFVNIPKPKNESFVIPKPIQIQGFNSINLNQQNGQTHQILAPIQIQGFNSITQKQIQPQQISSEIPSVFQKQEVSLEPQKIYETLSISQQNQENSLQAQRPLEKTTESQNQEISLKQPSEEETESQNQEVSLEPQKIYETLSISQQNQENSLQTQQKSENPLVSRNYKIIRLQMDEINEFIMKSQEEKENKIEIMPNNNVQNINEDLNNDNKIVLSEEQQKNKLNDNQENNSGKMPIIHKHPIFYPLDRFNTLDKANRDLVIDANDNHEKQFLVGKYLIKGENNFPQDIELGLKYLNESKTAKCTNAIIFYINMLIKGDIYPQDFHAAKKIINQNFNSKDPHYFVLLGKLSKKKKHYSNAIKYFEKGVKIGNSESIYQYAKMLFFGLCVKKNAQEAFKYFFISKNNGHQKSQSFLSAYQFMSTIVGFKSLPSETQSFFISSVAKNGINENNNKNLKFDKLKIKPDKTEAFFINNSLQTPEFISFLHIFKNIIVYIKYPSKLYKQILDLISKIYTHIYISIEIFVTNFDKIDTDVINVTISPHVHEIPDNAFIKCTYLTTITIPFTVTKIGKNAFSGCSSLQNVYMPPTITKIKQNAFLNCSLINQITVPSSVTVIEKYSFKGCTSLEKINLPSELIRIEEHAFEGCSLLKEIEIPSHVTSIGKYAFCGCISIRQIRIPFLVKTIEDYTFDNCSSLISFEIPSNIFSIGNYSFRKCSSLIQVVIPSSVKSIGCYAFSECSFLRDIVIDSSLDSIGKGAFSNCSNLTSVIFEENSYLLSIEENLFYECKSLFKITMPNSLKSIEKYAFYCCSSLEKVDIPPSVKKIGDSAFKGCSDLVTIKIPTYLVEIEPDVFDECPSLVKVGRHIGDISLNSLEAPTNFDMYKERKQITFLYRTIPNSAFNGSKLLKQIIILSSVLHICKGAFYNCVSLEKIIFHANSDLESIEEYAFCGCKSLCRIEIPSSVIKIGNNAFYDCDNLTYISHSRVVSIGINAFPTKAMVVYNNND